MVADARGVDATATRGQRQTQRERRVRARLASARDLEGTVGRAIRLDASTAARLRVAVGSVVEIVNPRGAPLRGWVTAIGNGIGIAISPLALRMLGIRGDTEVEIRAVHSGMLG